jgi:hypothetical protein
LHSAVWIVWHQLVRAIGSASTSIAAIRPSATVNAITEYGRP